MGVLLKALGILFAGFCISFPSLADNGGSSSGASLQNVDKKTSSSVGSTAEAFGAALAKAASASKHTVKHKKKDKDNDNDNDNDNNGNHGNGGNNGNNGNNGNGGHKS